MKTTALISALFTIISHKVHIEYTLKIRGTKILHVITASGETCKHPFVNIVYTHTCRNLSKPTYTCEDVAGAAVGS